MKSILEKETSPTNDISHQYRFPQLFGTSMEEFEISVLGIDVNVVGIPKNIIYTIFEETEYDIYKHNKLVA